MNLWVFDNDGTLYDDSAAETQFMQLVRNYFSKLLGEPVERMDSLIAGLKQEYNTSSTLIALGRKYGFDLDEAIEETYLKLDLTALEADKSEELTEAIGGLPGTRVVLTNNPSQYARKALAHLGLIDHFADIIGMEEVNLNLKPNPVAFRTVMKRFPGFDRILFCDDRVPNLDAARELGWETFLYKARKSSREAELFSNGHKVLLSLAELASEV